MLRGLACGSGEITLFYIRGNLGTKDSTREAPGIEPHNDLRSNSDAGWFIRLHVCHRAEKLELLKLPNEEREGALRQTCCGCVGLEIDKKLICHTKSYDPVVFTSEAFIA